MRALIAGHGFLGAQIATVLQEAGYEITVIRRTAQAGGNSGIKFVSADLMVGFPSLTEPEFDAAVFCLAPGKRVEAGYRDTYVTAQRHFLAAARARHYVYISSTGVYPQGAGTFDETAGSADGERSAILLEAEQWAVSAQNTVVLRLAGLYSQQRRIFNGDTPHLNEDKIIHFIHRDDAARAVAHALAAGLTGIYNVHDGRPLKRSEILARLGYAKEPALPAPQRRISHEKFFATGFRPHYADYFQGTGL